MLKIPKQQHTPEFRTLAVQCVKDGNSISVVARELGISERTWLKAAAAGTLNGPGAKVVTPEQMEMSRLKSENRRLTMELEIAKKSGVLRGGNCCYVRLF